MRDRALPPCIDLLPGVCGLAMLPSSTVSPAADLPRREVAALPTFVDWSG